MQRDLIGYRGALPKVIWPNKARIALNFVLNYEEGSESNQNALRLVCSYNMEPKFEVMRMYRNGLPSINLKKEIYGIASFELG